MSKAAAILKLENKHLKKGVPHFEVGDTIRVHTRIIEGEKERIQMFTGTVIARSGTGLSETFSLHRVAYGEGMERVFPLHSPRIAKIEVLKEGKVRRAKLYYLRGTSGKKAKVKGRLGVRREYRGIAAEQEAEQAPQEQEEIKEETAVAEAQEPVAEEVKAETPSSESASGEQKQNESASS